MLYFKGQAIPGSHSSIIGGAPELQVRRIKYWDTAGEAEIIGDLGGRSLVVQHTLYNFCTTPPALINEINKLGALIGSHGLLAERIGEIDFEHYHCTFDGFDPDVLPGQRDPGILKDLARTLRHDDGTADGGWFITLLLKFHQLHVRGNAF